MDAFKALAHWLKAGGKNRLASLPDDYVDIVTLSENRLIQVRGIGESITGIQASVANRVASPLKVRILQGTHFVSSGGFQNMVTRREYEFTLHPGATQHISLAVCCMNADLRIPKSGDKFVGIARAPEELCRFLQAAVDEDAMTIQAGVWAVTNRYTREMLQYRLRKRNVPKEVDRGFSSFGTRHDGGPAMTDEQIDRAAALLKELGIPHRLKSRAEMLLSQAYIRDCDLDLKGAPGQYHDETIHALAESHKRRAA